MSEENTQEAMEPKKTTTKKTAKKTTAKQELPKKEDGSIDWLKLIPEEFIVAQDKSKADIPISELKDNEKMVLLGGWKYLLKLRGFKSKKDIIHSSSKDFVSASCEIVWLPHEDSGMQEQVYYASADSHDGNTDPFMCQYHTANAQNRAFVRCVREYLNIHIVGKDELSKNSIPDFSNESKGVQSVSPKPQQVLEKIAASQNKNLSSALKWISEKQELPKEKIEKIKSWGDIPENVTYKMIGYLMNKKK